MEPTDPAILTDETFAERERLAKLFDDFGPEQWAAPSLCAGWRVREVVAHMTMPFRLSPIRFFGGMVRARFRFNRFADRDARATARSMSDEALAELYRDNVRHPWRPPGGGQAGALGHEVIHGLDATEPLGLPGPPPDRIALMFKTSGPRNLDFFGVDLDDARLVATDTELSIGDGEPCSLAAKDIVLVVTGRRELAEIRGER